MPADETALHVPEQWIPAPKSLSPQAQAYLSAAAQRVAANAATAAKDDHATVLEGAAEALKFLRPAASRFQGASETLHLPSGAKLYRATPQGRSGRRAEVALFDVHGGGFITGGGEMCELLTRIRAADYGVEVFSVDYRQLPDHPYPAGLDDCLEAYREALKHYPAQAIVMSGASAGGNLASALLLRGRAEGLPPPAALLLITPGLDLTLSGDSHRTNRFLDVSLYGGVDYLPAYAGAEAPSHPLVSPLFGDFTKGWPPTCLITGTRDLLLSDTVRMHRALRRAGVAAELHVTEAGPHTGFMGAPEDAEIMAEARRFVFSHWGVALGAPAAEAPS